MKRGMQWTVGVALVVAAWGIAALTPPEEAYEAPFAVQASVGEQATGRNLQATITSVEHADRISSGDWSADGNWVVVDLSASTVVAPGGLYLASLTIGDLTYSASERPQSFRNESLDAGVPRKGSLAFELPADLRTGEATLRLSLTTAPRLDSVIEMSIDLGTLDHVGTAQLRPTVWGSG